MQELNILIMISTITHKLSIRIKVFINKTATIYVKKKLYINHDFETLVPDQLNGAATDTHLHDSYDISSPKSKLFLIGNLCLPDQGLLFLFSPLVTLI